MASQPILSIVIPAYNAAAYCAACFDSILRSGSDPARYEVVVVDDGSQDATPEIIRSYCDAHANFSVVRQENGGVSVELQKDQLDQLAGKPFPLIVVSRQ